jgi:hypothetical protein
MASKKSHEQIWEEEVKAAEFRRILEQRFATEVQHRLRKSAKTVKTESRSKIIRDGKGYQNWLDSDFRLLTSKTKERIYEQTRKQMNQENATR